jgi:putative phosphoesterase
MKIGLISDTHLAGSGRGLPGAVLEALAGVDLILHCGDLECLGVLDHLESVAPVLAVRGYEDPTEPGDRLAHTTRVVEAEGVRIGMVHDIQWPSPRITPSADARALHFPAGSARDILARKFQGPVDVVVFGDTHQELICYYDGVLLINPGSPTYPALRRPGCLGTLGLLEVQRGVVTVRLVDLEEFRKGQGG